MPNISFDVFFDQDFINVSASRAKHAPKAKPEWKVRTAPKLPPKEITADLGDTPRPPQRPTINSTRTPAKLAPKSAEKPIEAADKPAQQTRRKPPKLGPRKTSATPSTPPV